MSPLAEISVLVGGLPGILSGLLGGAVGFGTFVWPGNNHFLSGYDFSEVHRGIDISGNTGEATYATDAGVIVYAGWNNYGYGNMVMIDHGNGFRTLYAHLNSVFVSPGESVSKGTQLGTVGNTGNSTGPHLHMGVYSIAAGGDYGGGNISFYSRLKTWTKPTTPPPTRPR